MGGRNDDNDDDEYDDYDEGDLCNDDEVVRQRAMIVRGVHEKGDPPPFFFVKERRKDTAGGEQVDGRGELENFAVGESSGYRLEQS